MPPPPKYAPSMHPPAIGSRDRREAHAAKAGAYIAFWFDLPARPTTDLLEKAQRELAEALRR